MYSDSIPSTRSLIRNSDDRVHGCHSPTHSVSLLCVRWLTGVRGDQDASLASYALMHLFLVIVFAAFICCILVGWPCLTCIQDFYTSRTVYPCTRSWLVQFSPVYYSCILSFIYQETVRMISARCYFSTMYISCCPLRS